jgi:PRC-barrel domain
MRAHASPPKQEHPTMDTTTQNRDPALDRDRDTDLQSKNEWHPLIASDRVEGTAVYDRDGEKLGTVRKLMLGKLDGQVRYVVMGSGGLFGFGEDDVPLPWDALDFDTELGGYKMRNLSKEDLDREKAPSYARDQEPDWSQDYDRTVRLYYFRTF